MSKIEEVVLEAMVKLVRQVPWGPSRAELLEKSHGFARDASMERGYDNYSTAGHLDWQASLYRLAAEARFPRDGDTRISRFRREIEDMVVDLVCAYEHDDDIGESSRIIRNGIMYSIPELSDDDLDALTDELAAMGRVDDPAYRKALRHGHDGGSHSSGLGCYRLP